MSGNKQITVTLEGYDVDQINEKIGRMLMRDYEISVHDYFEHEVQNALTSIIDQKVDDHMTKMVHNILSEGIIVSYEPNEIGGVDRKPVENVVLEAANDWMNKQVTLPGSNIKLSIFEKVAKEIIHTELSKQVTEILKGVKKEAIIEAQKNIASIVAERLFDGKNTLPAIR